ncbi:beta-lactamase family protein [Microbacterium sp. CBA3102]|uniref:serine hydrolase domain-containing protein n=1 Tax=Microbacterium sp. CBA3102 TaxID=2603598 RepID=UPI0011BB39DF|nr:serine hydrolase domain-containing protein [Microbacterium sp. CBA3102]QEA27918.1 beta-lactamase family protein [Microbacterium sp. CBA3102]
MVNGAPGSAWAALRSMAGVDTLELLGTLSADDPTPVSEESLFDLASVTKVFTAVAALRLVDAGLIALDEPCAAVLSIGSGPGSGAITLRQLLLHTSGLPAEGGMWRSGLRGAALQRAVVAADLVSGPGTEHRYSDVGFIAVGTLLERVSGRPLAQLIAEVAALLGADTLTWSPDPRHSVATEIQPHRGLVRAEVHDELASALGRPAGHAGLFGTVHDVAALARMIRDDGGGPRRRVLSAASARMLTVPAVRADGFEQALGLRVRQRSWMGDGEAVGHTGFTGTAFAVNPHTGDFGVLLLNRVHPTREDADVTGVRREFFAFLSPDKASDPLDGDPQRG